MEYVKTGLAQAHERAFVHTQLRPALECLLLARGYSLGEVACELRGGSVLHKLVAAGRDKDNQKSALLLMCLNKCTAADVRSSASAYHAQAPNCAPSSLRLYVVAPQGWSVNKTQQVAEELWTGGVELLHLAEAAALRANAVSGLVLVSKNPAFGLESFAERGHRDKQKLPKISRNDPVAQSVAARVGDTLYIWRAVAQQAYVRVVE